MISEKKSKAFRPHFTASSTTAPTEMCSFVLGASSVKVLGNSLRVPTPLSLDDSCCLMVDPLASQNLRYRAIVKEPLLYSAYFTKRDLAETVIYLWILPIATMTIQLLLISQSEISYNNQTFICESAWTSRGATVDAKIAIFSAALFISPLFVIMILYYSVFTTAREKGVERPAGVASQVQVVHREKFQHEHRASIDVFVVVGAFLLLFLPLWVSVIARRFLHQDGLDQSLYAIRADLTFSSSVCNPFIYAIRKRQLRQAISSVLRCRGRGAGQVTPQGLAPERWAVPPGSEIKETGV